MKLTIPRDEILEGGALETLVNDLTNTNSEFSNATDGTNQIISDTNVSNPANKLAMDQATLLTILGVGGEMEEHLMALRVDNGFGALPVTDGLPRRKNAIGAIRNYVDWFIEGSELWLEDVGNGLIFYSNPAGGLAGISDFLTGTHMEIIRQLDTINYSIITTTDADAITGTGWTKVDWENL